MIDDAVMNSNWPVVSPTGPELPALPEHYVERPRLERLLTSAVQRARVTAITAPAVSGKTTLLAGWSAASHTPPLAYVALDPYDNELARFCSKVVGALQHVHPGIGATALGELAASGNARRFLDMLLPEIANLDFTVVALDGLESIDNPDLRRVLGDLLVGLPPTLRVILASRTQPALRLGLLRARGQLVEIPAGSLAFQIGEIAAYLDDWESLRCEPDETLALHERTEGWAGGVTLAALSAAQHDDPLAAIRHFTGSNRYVADVFSREVLEPEPPDVQQFLLATSVLDELDAPLCDVVTGRADSGATLEHLERAGTFTAAVDDDRTRYRYGPLFREFLQRELDVLDPTRAQTAHRAAAVELERRKDVTRAIEHYVAGGQPEEGLRMLLDHGEAVLAAGEVETLRHWLDVLPDNVLTSDIAQMLEIGHLCLMAGVRDDAMVWLERARVRLDVVPDPDPDLLARHALYVGYVDCLDGDLEGAAREGYRILTMAADREAVDGSLRDKAHHMVAAASGGMDEFSVAHRHLSAAPSCPSGDVPTDSYASWLYYREGLLDRALDCANRVLDAIELPWQWPTVLISRGAVGRERNHLDEAETDLVQGIDLAKRWGRRRVVSLGGIERAQLLYAAGRSTEAFELLAETRREVRGAYIGQLLDAAEAGLRLRDGDVDQAAALRTKLAEGRLPALLDVRIALARGRTEEASTVLSSLEGRARSVRDRISSRLLRGQAQLPVDAEAAEKSLRWAIDLARRERFVQVFVEDLGPLTRLLRTLCAAEDDPFASGLLAAVTHDDLDSHTHYLIPTESLSAREQIVLRYLPTTLPNKRIASELHMSVNTLKTHLKSLYRKLGVGSREEAVSHARYLKLI